MFSLLNILRSINLKPSFKWNDRFGARLIAQKLMLKFLHFLMFLLAFAYGCMAKCKNIGGVCVLRHWWIRKEILNVQGLHTMIMYGMDKHGWQINFYKQTDTPIIVWNCREEKKHVEKKEGNWYRILFDNSSFKIALMKILCYFVERVRTYAKRCFGWCREKHCDRFV